MLKTHVHINHKVSRRKKEIPLVHGKMLLIHTEGASFISQWIYLQRKDQVSSPSCGPGWEQVWYTECFKSCRVDMGRNDHFALLQMKVKLRARWWSLHEDYNPQSRSLTQQQQLSHHNYGLNSSLSLNVSRKIKKTRLLVSEKLTWLKMWSQSPIRSLLFLFTTTYVLL